ncbi:MAG: hypothetical protein ACOYIK_01295 [Coriobacteriales bacterium]
MQGESQAAEVSEHGTSRAADTHVQGAEQAAEGSECEPEEGEGK